jgi:hypothetical protein
MTLYILQHAEQSCTVRQGIISPKIWKTPGLNYLSCFQKTHWEYLWVTGKETEGLQDEMICSSKKIIFLKAETVVYLACFCFHLVLTPEVSPMPSGVKLVSPLKLHRCSNMLNEITLGNKQQNLNPDQTILTFTSVFFLLCQYFSLFLFFLFKSAFHSTFLLLLFLARSHRIAQTGLKLVILQPQLSKFWD